MQHYVPPPTDEQLHEYVQPLLRLYATHLMRGREGKRAQYRNLFSRLPQAPRQPSRPHPNRNLSTHYSHRLEQVPFHNRKSHLHLEDSCPSLRSRIPLRPHLLLRPWIWKAQVGIFLREHAHQVLLPKRPLTQCLLPK